MNTVKLTAQDAKDAKKFNATEKIRSPNGPYP